MQILVANLGSTSFKYRLFDVTGSQARMLAKGGSERVTDYRDASSLDAIGFKTVLGGDITGCLLADERVEKALLDTVDLAPAHNKPYAEGLRVFREKLPNVPRVALFETAFYQWGPTTRAAMPYQKLGTKRAFAATASTGPATNSWPNGPPICLATTMSAKLSAASTLTAHVKSPVLRCA